MNVLYDICKGDKRERCQWGDYRVKHTREKRVNSRQREGKTLWESFTHFPTLVSWSSICRSFLSFPLFLSNLSTDTYHTSQPDELTILSHFFSTTTDSWSLKRMTSMMTSLLSPLSSCLLCFSTDRKDTIEYVLLDGLPVIPCLLGVCFPPGATFDYGDEVWL